ncbi:MAG: glycosyl transferase group 1 [Actinomycetia bacterium]|nr:glycosyl transferase group 1 [Actinomycetes bacterium]
MRSTGGIGGVVHPEGQPGGTGGVVPPEGKHSRPRVALVVGPTAGGIGVHVRMLAAGLVAHGSAVEVLAPAGTAGRLGAGDLPVTFGIIDIGDHPQAAAARSALRLRRAVRGRVDVVHAHGLRAGALCALALAGTPASASAHSPALVVTVHNGPPPGRGRAAAAYRVLERVVARGADLVLCVSGDLEKRMRAAGARQVDRAVVPAPGKAPCDQGVLADASGRPVVLGVGRLAAQKGFATLLTAAASWQDMDPVPKVVIAGEGPLDAELRRQAAAGGVDASFLGRRDDVPALLAGCNVFVLPSRWEGQPLVLQEALRAGAAIVASRAGGIPELAGPGAAYLVAPGDAAQLAAGVRAVLLDQSLAARLRATALRRAGELPTEADAIAAVLAGYQRARTS